MGAFRSEEKLAAAETAIHEKNGSRLLSEEVTEDDVARVVATWTGIPVSRMLEGERQKLVRMESVCTSSNRLKWAVTAVANAVRRARSGLQDPQRPMGSFIFLWLTGG